MKGDDDVVDKYDFEQATVENEDDLESCIKVGASGAAVGWNRYRRL